MPCCHALDHTRRASVHALAPLSKLLCFLRFTPLHHILLLKPPCFNDDLPFLRPCLHHTALRTFGNVSNLQSFRQLVRSTNDSNEITLNWNTFTSFDRTFDSTDTILIQDITRLVSVCGTCTCAVRA